MQDHARARRLSRRRALGAAGAGTAELDIAERLPPKGPHLADDVEGFAELLEPGVRVANQELLSEVLASDRPARWVLRSLERAASND